MYIQFFTFFSEAKTSFSLSLKPAKLELNSKFLAISNVVLQLLLKNRYLQEESDRSLFHYQVIVFIHHYYLRRGLIAILPVADLDFLFAIQIIVSNQF